MCIKAMEVYELQGAAPLLANELGQKEMEVDGLRVQEIEAKRVEREKGPRVGGEELKRRIVGIGPRSEMRGVDEEREKEMGKDFESDSESDLEKYEQE